jgi:hypothetical protein
MSGSLSKAPISTSNKTLLVLIFVDPRLRPLTLAERGAHRMMAFHEAPPPRFLFLDKGAQAGGGASGLTRTTRSTTGHRASAFEEK